MNSKIWNQFFNSTFFSSIQISLKNAYLNSESYLCKGNIINMLYVETFTFNPFQEHTYIVYNESGNCFIVDPGCSDVRENDTLRSFIAQNKLKVARIILTHAHIDHVMGLDFVCKEYGHLPEMHNKDLPTLQMATQSAKLYGLSFTEGPAPEKFLTEGDILKIGQEKLNVIFTPGHSPGHVVFYSSESNLLLGGDVLFYEGIGRVDLPGGDGATLVKSIREKLYTLPEETKVYPGHGPSTTIGHEKRSNPFVQG